MRGQARCYIHGGKSPNALAKAQERLKEQKARQTAAAMVVAWEGEIEGDPLLALLRMVQTAAMAERAYAALLQAETQGQLLTEVDYGKAGGIRTEPHPYLKLWNEERDRLAKVSKMAIDANIAERQVSLATEQAQLLVDTLNAVITDLKLDPQTAERARLTAANQLRLAAARAA